MKIASGLLDGMVIRRNSANVSEQYFEGVCSRDGDVVVSITGPDGKTVRAFGKTVCGTAAGGRFSGILTGLKAGGPYRIALSVGKETVTVEDVLVGDVWILGGQSNMQGTGNLSGACRELSPMVRAYYMDDHWGMAKDPMIQPRTANAPVHWKLMGIAQPAPPRKWRDASKKGTGPGVSFGNEMFRKTGIPQGLIACAHGGTKMEQWSPALKKMGDDSLYGAMMNRIKRNGGQVSGMVWYQGCSDANAEDAPLFRKRMIQLVKSLRKDLSSPALPFVQVQISRLAYSPAPGDFWWTAIREIQRTLPKSVKHLLTVSAIDLELDDNIHLSGSAQGILGKRLAEAMLTLRGEKNALPPPPDFESVRIKMHPLTLERLVTVKFRNIAGKLEADGRPCGFFCNGEPTDRSFRTELKGDSAILHYDASLPISEIGYGCGCNPFCNLHDSAGRALPAFAFQSVSDHTFKTPYACLMEVSEPVLGSEALDSVSYGNTRKLSYTAVPANGPFVIPADRVNFAAKSGVRFFRSAFLASEPQALRLLLGYDGPVKVFCDGTEIYTDKKGTNPVLPEQYSVDVFWEKGRHEVVIALALNHGGAWGVSLCIAGRDGEHSRNAKRNYALPVEIGARR